MVDIFSAPGGAEQVALLLVMGLVAGVHSSFFGVGGGWIITPLLNMLGLPVTYAVGTGMAFLAGTGVMSSWRHLRHGHGSPRLAVLLGLPMLAGIALGQTVLMRLDRAGGADDLFRILYVLLLSGMGLGVLRNARRPSPTGQTLSPARGPSWPPMMYFPPMHLHVSLWTLIATGLVSGGVASVLGVGGGFILVPVMMYAMGLPPLVSVATSLFCIALGGVSGTISYAMAGRVQWMFSLWLVAGAYLGVRWGVWAARRIEPASFKVLYGAMLLIGAGAVALRQTAFNVLAPVVLLTGTGGLALAILIWAARCSYKKD